MLEIQMIRELKTKVNKFRLFNFGIRFQVELFL